MRSDKFSVNDFILRHNACKSQQLRLSRSVQRALTTAVCHQPVYDNDKDRNQKFISMGYFSATLFVPSLPSLFSSAPRRDVPLNPARDLGESH